MCSSDLQSSNRRVRPPLVWRNGTLLASPVVHRVTGHFSSCVWNPRAREVPCSALKGETVPYSLPATPKSPPTRRGPPRGTPRFPAPRSVVSDPQRPHGLQPSRLLRPWDFPGKSTGVGCHCLLRYRHCIPGCPGESGLVSRGSQGLRSPLESRRGSLGLATGPPEKFPLSTSE